MFLASAAAGVTTQLVSNWNTAYTWGDHGVAGYLTDITSSSVGSLSDVAISGAQNDQLLKYNGTNWINFTPNYLTSFTETDTLATVTARGASTTTPTTFLNVTVSGNLSVLGTTTSNNTTSLNVSDTEIVLNSGQANGALSGVIRNDRGSDADVSIRWYEVTDKWQFTNDGTTYYDLPTAASDLTNDAGYLTSTGSISSHTDVVVSSPQNDQILKYNGSQWVNTTFSTTAQVLVQDAAPSNPQPGDMWWKSDEGTLKIYYSDVDTNQWVDASPIGDPFENTYASIAFFPQANVSEGAFAFSEATDAMYYSNGYKFGLITELLLKQC